MENQDFFDDIRQRINDYSSPMDSDQEWQSLQERRDGKNRRRLAWIVLALLFPIILVSLYQRSGKSVDTPPFTKEQNGDVTSIVAAPNFTTDELALTQEAEELTLPAVIDQEDQIASSPSPNFDLGHATTLPDILAEPSSSNALSAPSDNTSLLEESVPESAPLLALPQVYPFGYKIEMPASFLDPIKIPEVTTAPKYSPGLSKHVQAIVPKIGDQATISSRMMPVSISHPKPPLLRLYASDPDPTPALKTRELILVGGLGQTQQLFTQQGTDTIALARHRQNSERPLETYTLELGIRWSLSEQTFLYSGLNYQQWHDRFAGRFELSRNYLLEDVLIRIETDVFGQTTEIYGDTMVWGRQITEVVHHNRFNNFGLVLGIGTNLWAKDRWRLSAQLDLTLDLGLQAQGKHQTRYQTFTDVGQANSYQSKLGWGVRGQFQFAYQLNDRLSVSCNPFFQYRFTTLSPETYALRTNYWRAGALVGIGYKF